jgi:hypothetical protein
LPDLSFSGIFDVSLRRPVKKYLSLILIFVLASFVWRQHAAIQRAPGILTPGDPEQTLFVGTQPPIEKDGWTLKPLAFYTIQARVLAKMHYSGDDVSKLAPYDLALGWGRMSDTAVLERLDISQSNRFYRWQCWGNTPIPEKEMVTHSANNHLIPADDSIADKIAGLRVGSLVKISGFLVEANHPHADHAWRSSLTRDDSGDGACEIIYVKAISEME